VISALDNLAGPAKALKGEPPDVREFELRNWEPVRREPTGPAKALLRAISRDPKNVLQALAG